MKKTPFKQNKSFSLIELIISLAILAVVIFLLLPLLYQGIRLWQFDRDSEFALKEARLALLRMSDEISQADSIDSGSSGSQIIFHPSTSPSTFVQFSRGLVGGDANDYQCISMGLFQIQSIQRTWWPSGTSDDVLRYLEVGPDCTSGPNDITFNYFDQNGNQIAPSSAVRRVNFGFNVQKCNGNQLCAGTVDPVHHFETAAGLRNKE